MIGSAAGDQRYVSLCWTGEAPAVAAGALYVLDPFRAWTDTTN